MTPFTSRYAAAIFSVVLAALGALTALTDFTWASVDQIIALVAASLLTYLVPLLKGPWAAGLKVGLEVLGTLLALILPFIVAGHITPQQAIVVLIGLLKALATQLGVDIRLDALHAGSASPRTGSYSVRG